jgi:uroporphyrinogen-III synthase
MLADAVSGCADPGAGILLHAAGEDAGSALSEKLTAVGFRTRRQTLYRVEKSAQLPPHASRALRQGEVDAALFFSPKSAALFAECAVRDGLSTDRLIAICISANTADALKGLAFSEMRIASAPNQTALLACI